MIKSFKHKGLEDLFYDGSTRGVLVNHAAKLTDILDALDAAVAVQDMNIPGLKLHQLKGKRKDHWSVTVNGNWRVVFTFNDGNAYVVDYVDYH